MKLLVAVDGSAESVKALEHAIELAAPGNWPITAVHAVDPEVRTAGGVESVEARSDFEAQLIQENPEDAEKRGTALLERMEATAAEHGAEIETAMLDGDPAEVVPDFAESGSFDHVVVGHRGLSEEFERVLGSVAMAIVERSTVPVTVVD